MLVDRRMKLLTKELNLVLICTPSQYFYLEIFPKSIIIFSITSVLVLFDYLR